jgi:flagellar biosynthesis protein FlhF
MFTAHDKNALRVKSFFASSFQDAMKQAQTEMGHDALLLNSRETPPEARHLGTWEVMFGAASEPPKEVPAANLAANLAASLAANLASNAPPSPQPNGVPNVNGAATGGGDEIRGHLDEIRSLLKRLASSPQPMPQNANSIVGQALIDAGLERNLAQEIEDAVNLTMNRNALHHRGNSRNAPVWDRETLLTETAREINNRFDVQPEIGNVTALVGPPGCGKTTALINLAVTQGLLKGRPVQLISTDTARIAAVEPLRTYAGILGVQFRAAGTTAVLDQAIGSAPGNALILIDTPGYSASALEQSATELAWFLSQRHDIDTHLVLTASMRAADLKRMADRFEIFSPSKLLFTKLDETDSLGAVFGEAATRKKPLSYFSDGVLIPESIQPAAKAQVIENLVRQLPQALQMVA